MKTDFVLPIGQAAPELVELEPSNIPFFRYNTYVSGTTFHQSE